MTLSEAIRVALACGCELEPSAGGGFVIRAIAYDADPYELSEAALLDLTAEQFRAEWIPERI